MLLKTKERKIKIKQIYIFQILFIYERKNSGVLSFEVLTNS